MLRRFVRAHPFVSYYGLDQPFIVQLVNSLGRFLVGDFGLSLRSNLPVSQLILDALGSTLQLAFAALLVAVVLAVGIAYGTQFLPARYGQGLLRSLPSLGIRYAFGPLEIGDA